MTKWRRESTTSRHFRQFHFDGTPSLSWIEIWWRICLRLRRQCQIALASAPAWSLLTLHCSFRLSYRTAMNLPPNGKCNSQVYDRNVCYRTVLPPEICFELSPVTTWRGRQQTGLSWPWCSPFFIACMQVSFSRLCSRDLELLKSLEFYRFLHRHRHDESFSSFLLLAL